MYRKHNFNNNDNVLIIAEWSFIRLGKHQHAQKTAYDHSNTKQGKHLLKRDDFYKIQEENENFILLSVFLHGILNVLLAC